MNIQKYEPWACVEFEISKLKINHIHSSVDNVFSCDAAGTGFIPVGNFMSMKFVFSSLQCISYRVLSF